MLLRCLTRCSLSVLAANVLTGSVPIERSCMALLYESICRPERKSRSSSVLRDANAILAVELLAGEFCRSCDRAVMVKV